MPGIARENYWFRRHEAAYLWVAEHFSGRVVVDAGSGEGYGADLLRRAGAEQVLALEYDEAAARHCAATYPAATAVRANLDSLPVADRTADLLVSMQVIEHLWDLPRFLRESRRVLRPGGSVVVTTPNRVTFSPGLGRGEKPTNPFHVEEFDAEQVADLLRAAGFHDVAVLGLHHGPRIPDDLVPRQVAAVLADCWPPDLLAVVAGVTARDFVIGSAEGCLDLIGVGRA